MAVLSLLVSHPDQGSFAASPQRKVNQIDMDAFYASIEQRDKATGS
jgi:hypothetical protein